jgi:predicted aspartyl protease
VPKPYYEEGSDFPSYLLDSINIYSLSGESFGRFSASGKIDTGSTWCVIPVSAVENLSLDSVDDVPSEDAHGNKKDLPYYWVRLEIEGLVNKLVQVTASKKNYFLIGRNVLHDLRMSAYPANRELSLERP